jgi:hypothetical protein
MDGRGDWQLVTENVRITPLIGWCLLLTLLKSSIWSEKQKQNEPQS